MKSAPNLTLRQVSAQAFWGDSKFLERHEQLIQMLFPGLPKSLVIRPIMLAVHLPVEVTGILLIENQDCFLQACRNQYPPMNRLAIVYSQGFKATAVRGRSRDSVLLSYVETSEPGQRQLFEKSWFGQDNRLPFYFWGDLDFAALQMIKNLRHSFPHLQAWQPGYQDMVAELANGHPGTKAHRKGEQQDIGETGCHYADNILRPALLASGLFLDQEWWLNR